MSKFSRKIAGVFAGLLLSLNLQAVDQIAVTPNHPDRYEVQVGDTLWDIAARFLEAPWRWPDVWQVNPQIPDPHLIYPGDVIALSFDANGKPVLSLERNGSGSAIKLSPKVRIEEITQPIPAIPIDAIRNFLVRPYVVSPDDMEDAPHVLAISRDRLVGAPGQRIYVRDPEERPLSDTKYHVVRPGKMYKHDETGERLGQEARYIGEVQVIRQGDPATVEIVESALEIIQGDRLIPMTQSLPTNNYFPKAPANPRLECSILSSLNDHETIAQYDVVALDCGKREGVVEGDVMVIKEEGRTIYDPLYVDEEAPERRSRHMVEFFDGERKFPDVEKYVIPDPEAKETLPDERIGTLMVFRTLPRLSFALVLRAEDAIRVDDTAHSPTPY